MPSLPLLGVLASEWRVCCRSRRLLSASCKARRATSGSAEQTTPSAIGMLVGNG